MSNSLQCTVFNAKMKTLAEHSIARYKSRDPFFEKYLNKYDVIYLDITEFTSDAFVKKKMGDVVVDLERRVILSRSGKTK